MISHIRQLVKERDQYLQVTNFIMILDSIISTLKNIIIFLIKSLKTI